MLDFLHGVIDLNKVKHVKKDRRGINTCDIVSNKRWDWCMTKDKKSWNGKSNAKKISSINTF